MPAVAQSCTSCGKPFRIIASQAGKKVRCPLCSEVNTIPVTAFTELRDEQGPVSQDSDSHGSDLQSMTSAFVSTEPVGNRLAALTTAFKSHKSNEKTSHSNNVMMYTHSSFAGSLSVVGKSVMLVAIIVEVYILIATEWGQIANLPMKLALPAYAVTFFPAGLIAITGLFLLAAAHSVEYLARIAAATEPS